MAGSADDAFRRLSDQLFDQLDLDHNGIITHEDLDRLEAAHALPQDMTITLRSRLGPRRPVASSQVRATSMPPAATRSQQEAPAIAAFGMPLPGSITTRLPPSSDPMIPWPTPTSNPRRHSIRESAIQSYPVRVAASQPVAAQAQLSPPTAPAHARVVTTLPPASAQPAPVQRALVQSAPVQPAPSQPPQVQPPAVQFPPPPPPVAQNSTIISAPVSAPAPVAPPPAVVAPPAASPPAAAASPNIPDGATPEEIFDLMDQNKNGFVTKEEFKAALLKYRSRPVVVQPAPPAVEVVQATGPEVEVAVPGGIDPTYEELFLYRDLDGELTGSGGEVFAQIDKNADGVITREEFLRAFEGNRRIGLREGVELHWDGIAGDGADGDEWEIGAGGEYRIGADGEYYIGGGDVNVGFGDYNIGGGMGGGRPGAYGGKEGADEGLDVKFQDPNVHVYGPNVHVQGGGRPGVYGGKEGADEGLDVKFQDPNVHVYGPNVHVQGPNVQVNGPNVHLHGPNMNGKFEENWSYNGQIGAGQFGYEGGKWEYEGGKFDYEGGAFNYHGHGQSMNCCERTMHMCESGIDYCETFCCIPFLYQCAICCGLNLKADESLRGRLFPWMFTFLLFILFATPIWLILQVSYDMQVRYWISDQLHVVLILPLMFLLVQWWQASKARIIRTLVCFTLVGSCVFLLGLGDLVLLSSYNTANALFANDCSTHLEKQKLQIQWQNAELFYTDCMAQTAAATGSSLEVAYGLYRIQDCTGYSDQLSKNPAWPYLGALEQNFDCGGWCTRSQPLWTFKSVKDSCSTTVADILHNKVQWTMLQVLVYTAVVLALVSVALIQTGPIVRSHGVKW